MAITGYVLLGMLLWQIVCFAICMICIDEDYYRMISSGLVFLIIMPIYKMIKKYKKIKNNY